MLISNTLIASECTQRQTGFNPDFEGPCRPTDPAKGIAYFYKVLTFNNLDTNFRETSGCPQLDSSYIVSSPSLASSNLRSPANYGLTGNQVAPASLLALAPARAGRQPEAAKQPIAGADLVINLDKTPIALSVGAKGELSLGAISAETGVTWSTNGPRLTLGGKLKIPLFTMGLPVGQLTLFTERRGALASVSPKGFKGPAFLPSAFKLELKNPGLEISLSIKSNDKGRNISWSECKEIMELVARSCDADLTQKTHEQLFNKACTKLVYLCGKLGLEFALTINVNGAIEGAARLGAIVNPALAGFKIPKWLKFKVEFGGQFAWSSESVKSVFAENIDHKSDSSETFLMKPGKTPSYKKLNYFRIFRGHERKIENRLQDYNNVWMVGEKEYQRVVFSPWDETKKNFQNYGSSALQIVNQLNQSLRQLYKGGGSYKNAKSKSGMLGIPGALGGVGLAVGSYEDAASRLRLAYDWLNSKGFPKEAKALLTSVVNPLTDFGIPELKEMNNRIPRDPQRQKSLAVQRAYLRAGDTLDLSSTFGPIDRITPLTQTLPTVAPAAKH